MRTLFLALSTAALAVLVYALYPRSTCERTLAYGVGDVDPRFGVSPDEVREAARQAAGLWDDANGEPVFRYDPEAPFKIYLHYDERQPHALAAKRDKERIESEDAVLREVHGRYDALKAAFDSEARAYERDVAAWKAAGRPYEEAAALDSRRLALNSMAEQLNSTARQMNPAVDSLRAEIQTLNAQSGRPFDRGDFTGDRIDVYQFDDQKDLALILAHEFGHALSVDHAPDPKAVMYYLRNDQNFKELALTESDKKGLQLACAQLTILDPRTLARWHAAAARLLGR